MLATKPALSTRIDTAVTLLDNWLETMRGPGGYSGPVAHWWQQSLLYTGAGLDWRYEGIIAGYLTLWERTGQEIWLDKALKAGNDLISGQLENGHFPASAFEINPATAGTPHEAGCDVGLLLLALALKKAGRTDWQSYANCAQRNLVRFYVKQLWDEQAQSFRDSPAVPSFVPNKAATASEAFFLLSELTGDSGWAETYALPNLKKIMEHQLKSGKLSGAVSQNSFGARRIEKYIPIYNARCVSALRRGYLWTGNEEFIDSARRIMEFIVQEYRYRGYLPTVIYHDRSENSNPAWIAALGDVLRAAAELKPYGFEAEDFTSEILERLLKGQDVSGGIQTATGFAGQAGGKLAALPDVRDVLHVVGWCDKAFRYLATQVSKASLPEVQTQTSQFETECIFQGHKMRLVETAEKLEISYLSNHKLCYQWLKGETWANVANPEFWLR